MGFITWVFLMVGFGIGFLSRPQLLRLAERSRASQNHVTEFFTPPEATPPQLSTDAQDALLAYYLTAEQSQFRAGFLARTAHELRSPLSSIISLHQLVLSDLCEDHDEERECVAQAYNATQKLLALLDSLIMVSKAECGSSSPSLQPVSLAGIFEEVHALTHLLAQNRNLRLTIEPVEPDITVQTDARRLQQVLVMLVDMAIMLMDDGAIRMAAQSTDQGWVEIWLDDYRPAIAWQEPLNLIKLVSQDQEQLMQRLLTQIRQGSPISVQAIEAHLPGSSRSPVSVGMALMMCQILMEMVGGRLEIIDVPSVEDTNANAFNPSGRSRLSCCVPLAEDPS